MNKLPYILFAAFAFVMLSCSVDEAPGNPDLLSKWELMEELQPQGDRSVFVPVDRTETIEFLVDSKVKRSTSWCSQSNVTIGEYFDSSKSILVGCEENSLTFRYNIKGDFLFLYPNCVEDCALKYRRIDNLVGFVR